MSSVQLASDTDGDVVVEWSKYGPHYHVITRYSYRRYHTKEQAMRAAKRQARKLGVKLEPQLVQPD